MNDDGSTKGGGTGLEQLHDIVSTDAVSWFPSTLVAWLIICTVGLAVVSVLAFSLKKWFGRAYQRAALRELEGSLASADVSAILKRAALQVFPRQTVASLTGAEWYRWLGQFASGSTEIEKEFVSCLGSSREVVSADLLRFARSCIRGMPPNGNE